MLRSIFYDCSLLFTSYRHNSAFSPDNIQCWYVTPHQVPKLSKVIIQVIEKKYLAWFFKEIANNPSAVIWAYMNKHVINCSDLGKRQIGFDYYRSFPPDANDNKKSATTTFRFIPLLFVLGDDAYSILRDHPRSIAFISMQILTFDMDLLGIIFPLSGYWISKEQPRFIVKQLFNFVGQTTTVTIK